VCVRGSYKLSVNTNPMTSRSLIRCVVLVSRAFRSLFRASAQASTGGMRNREWVSDTPWEQRGGVSGMLRDLT
jgi:hypothetical protein